MKGTAVGFMSVCSTVDVELLSRCFDLKPFNGLQKLRGLTPPRGTFAPVKVPITPKYFFGLDNSLHLFKTHCAFLNQVLTFFYIVKVTKSSHHLSHDRASKGHGSIPCLMSQTSLHACLQKLNMMQISV